MWKPFSSEVTVKMILWLIIVFVSDVALVTSLRDGMNLVSYEFVACQDSKKGVLILSEVIPLSPSFCGCPQFLCS